MRLVGWTAVCLAVTLVACASTPPAPKQATPQTTPSPALRQFNGRLAITIESEPTQSLSAEFELEGDAKQGELRLYGPLVGLVAVVQWNPERAVLIEGDRRREVKSLDWLIERVSGAPIQSAMIFDWLNQRPVQTDDWWVEERTHSEDRLRAVRLQPLPRIELLMVLKKAEP